MPRLVSLAEELGERVAARGLRSATWLTVGAIRFRPLAERDGRLLDA